MYKYISSCTYIFQANRRESKALSPDYLYSFFVLKWPPFQARRTEEDEQKKNCITRKSIHPFKIFYLVNVVLHVNGAANLLDDDNNVDDDVAADDEAKYILYLASFIIMSDYTDHTHTYNEWKKNDKLR